MRKPNITERYRVGTNVMGRFHGVYFVPPLLPFIIKRVEFSLAFERSRREWNKLYNFIDFIVFTLDLIKRKCEGKENCSNCSTKCNLIRVILRIVCISEKILQLSRSHRLTRNLKHMHDDSRIFFLSCLMLLMLN